MELVTLIIQLLSGAAGGNIIGGLIKNLNLGPLGNSLAGIIGGGLGGQLLGPLLGPEGAAVAGAALDPMAILGQIATGGVSGGILTAIVGLVKQMMSK
jgi:hypothetical protein